MKALAWTLLGGIVLFAVLVVAYRIVVALVVITLYVKAYSLRREKRGDNCMCFGGGQQQAQAPVNPAPLPPDQAYKGVAMAVKPTGEPAPKEQPKPEAPKESPSGSNFGPLGM